VCLSCHCVVSRLPKVFILNRAIRELVLTGVVIVSSRALRAAMLSGVRRLVYRYQAPLTRLPRTHVTHALHATYPTHQRIVPRSREGKRAPTMCRQARFLISTKNAADATRSSGTGGPGSARGASSSPRCRLNVTACVNTEVLPRAVSATPPSIVIVAPCAMVRRFRALS
jgi:hypothetical protein